MSRIMNRQQIIKKIIPAMVAAPSAHNTQPWLFKVSNNEIVIERVLPRCLSASDRDGRQTYISLGCTAMNGLIAAANHGHGTQITYLPDSHAGIAIKLTLNNGPADNHLSPLLPAIFQRRTNRHPFTGQPLNTAEISALSAANNPNILLFSDPAQKTKIAELASQGTLTALAQPEFKAELARWVRNNWTRQPDGMPGYATGIPAPISIISPLLIKIFPVHRQASRETFRQINTASAIAVFVTARDAASDWIKTGLLLEQLWLEATAAGISAMPQAAAIEGSKEIRRQFNRLLQTDWLPQAILRLGHTVTPRSLRALPRRSVQDCLVN
jgi:nitroreductase